MIAGGEGRARVLKRRVVWIRHAEKAWSNREGFDGTIPDGEPAFDPPLADGAVVAHKLTAAAAVIGATTAPRVVSSPFRRCVETARVLIDSPPSPDSRIGEYLGNVGRMYTCFPRNCFSEETVASSLPDFWEKWSSVWARVADFSNEVDGLTGDVIIVTHGVVVNAAFYRHTSRLAEFKPLEGFYVEYDGGVKGVAVCF